MSSSQLPGLDSMTWSVRVHYRQSTSELVQARANDLMLWTWTGEAPTRETAAMRAALAFWSFSLPASGGWENTIALIEAEQLGQPTGVAP